MEVNLDLAALYQQAFGTPTDAFNPNLAPVIGDNSLTRVEAGAIAGTPYYATDTKLNREYFLPVFITYPDATPISEQQNGLLGGDTTGILKKWALPFPFVTIRASKNITETPLTEQGGSVKELINIKDYEITVRGFIISPTDDYPEADITTMRDLYECNSAVSMRCALTDIFLIRPARNGSDSVVITSLDFPGLKGVKNIEPYELKFLSDQIVNLIDIS